MSTAELPNFRGKRERKYGNSFPARITHPPFSRTMSNEKSRYFACLVFAFFLAEKKERKERGGISLQNILRESEGRASQLSPSQNGLLYFFNFPSSESVLQRRSSKRIIRTMFGLQHVRASSKTAIRWFPPLQSISICRQVHFPSNLSFSFLSPSKWERIGLHFLNNSTWISFLTGKKCCKHRKFQQDFPLTSSFISPTASWSFCPLHHPQFWTIEEVLASIAKKKRTKKNPKLTSTSRCFYEPPPPRKKTLLFLFELTTTVVAVVPDVVVHCTFFLSFTSRCC